MFDRKKFLLALILAIGFDLVCAVLAVIGYLLFFYG